MSCIKFYRESRFYIFQVCEILPNIFLRLRYLSYFRFLCSPVSFPQMGEARTQKNNHQAESLVVIGQIVDTLWAAPGGAIRARLS